MPPRSYIPGAPLPSSGRPRPAVPDRLPVTLVNGPGVGPGGLVHSAPPPARRSVAIGNKVAYNHWTLAGRAASDGRAARLLEALGTTLASHFGVNRGDLLEYSMNSGTPPGEYLAIYDFRVYRPRIFRVRMLEVPNGFMFDRGPSTPAQSPAEFSAGLRAALGAVPVVSPAGASDTSVATFSLPQGLPAIDGLEADVVVTAVAGRDARGRIVNARPGLDRPQEPSSEQPAAGPCMPAPRRLRCLDLD